MELSLEEIVLNLSLFRVIFERRQRVGYPMFWQCGSLICNIAFTQSHFNAFGMVNKLQPALFMFRCKIYMSLNSGKHDSWQLVILQKLVCYFNAHRQIFTKQNLSHNASFRCNYGVL